MDNLSKNLEECIICVLKNIGATLIGVKPAELRTIKVYDGSYNVWNRCKNVILLNEEVEVIELNKRANRKKVFFYHKSALDRQLSNSKIRNFLMKLGYPKEYDLKSYLDFLVTRLRKHDLGKRDFPHEIGIFFGYPLKDVLGFMGYSDLECTYRQEWKVYGEKNSSLLQKKKFNLARRQFNRKLEQVKNIDQFYKVI
ncbi:DUF3793 family protein [Selenihalanaerobacter shriftii]|uniref:DUF3793 family protein n=1 Tax=Selenihalanaerobacter shriftii TaxID=142842 RepID=A0A1T4KDD2_9FIRM|nr:DUF3793 family protein [Selenihalanaerobacter shriftii]SJZ40391.1 Protein of unknown function [Selenihalanaerobacter shriftii]